MNRNQLKTILWLRWRLTQNQWSRSRGIGAAIAVIVALAAAMLVVLSFGGGVAAGALALKAVHAEAIHWVWFGLTLAFLFLWTVGLLSELQRSEAIDLQRLMHLPVALGQMFCFNYIASHLTFSIFLFVPAILGLTVGLIISNGPIMILLAPLGLGMVFMISAWTYCLRGWLAAMMTNPRRRRAIIMGLTAAFILLGQAPNLYFNILRKFDRSPAQTAAARASRRGQNKRMIERIAGAERFIPPLWVAVGADGLAKSNPLPALGATLGFAALGGLGLRRAYRTTLRFYYGETGKKAPAPVKASAAPASGVKRRRSLLELRVPGVPEEALAVATATFRSFLRAPEVKMAWGTSFIVTLIAGASIVMSGASKMPAAARPFIIIGPMAFSLMMLLQFLTNQFGFDRDGFRALILSPADRKLILLGKNLATLPVVVTAAMLLLSLTAIWLKLPLVGVVAAIFQLVMLLLLAAIGSNLLSILVPYRIQPGSLKPTKLPGLSVLLMALCHILFPVVVLPVFIPPLAELLCQLAGVSTAIPINLLLSIILSLLLAFTYWKTLEPLGRLLLRREISILGKVTAEVE